MSKKDKKKVGIIADIVKKSKSTRQNWDSTWRDTALFVAPNKDDVFKWKNKSKGEEKHERLYDGSAEHFNELLASALHSMLTNPSSQWFELTTGDREIDRKPEVKDYLQKLVRRVHQLINNTNFQSEIHEVYLDLGCFGTGVMRMDEDDDNHFHFKSRPIYELQIRENDKGVIDFVATEDMMTVRTAFQKYGMESFGEEAKKLAEDLDKELEIIHVVMPNMDVKLRKLGAFSKPWASYHVWVKGELILREKGFHEFPYIVPRWIKTTGEIYGRSPGMKALPDIRMLNSIMKTTIRGAQKVVDPPIAVPDDGIMGRVNLTPGGQTSVRSGTGDEIKPILTGGKPELGVALMEDVRTRIKSAFFIDQLQLREGPQMTATEVNVRDDDRIRLLGPILGRQHFELLQPLIARIIGIMKRKNLLPADMPNELQNSNLEVFFSSQIARAQRIAEAQNLNRFLGAIAPMVEADPTTLDLIDNEKYVKLNADIYGVPEEIFRKPEELKQIREGRAAQQAKEQEMEETVAGSQVVKNTSNVLPLKSGK